MVNKQQRDKFDLWITLIGALRYATSRPYSNCEGIRRFIEANLSELSSDQVLQITDEARNPLGVNRRLWPGSHDGIQWEEWADKIENWTSTSVSNKAAQHHISCEQHKESQC